MGYNWAIICAHCRHEIHIKIGCDRSISVLILQFINYCCTIYILLHTEQVDD